jgi:uncharacterized SAM-binding protein YcdF (DUF218 family)
VGMFSRRNSAVREREDLKRPGWFRLIQRRTVWCPTWWGLLCLIILFVIPVAWWWNCGESYLSLTHRLPAEVLVVEGWIGRDGVQAAQQEFAQHGYQYVVACGGANFERWIHDPLSYSELAGRELVKLGVPPDKLLVAAAPRTATRRTYETALSVCRILHDRGIQPSSINVFTDGPHARRSRLVFAKVMRLDVGVVDWRPSGDAVGPWWWSSDRTKELLTETAGYLYEALFNSGRDSRFREVCAPQNSVRPHIMSSPKSLVLIERTDE